MFGGCLVFGRVQVLYYLRCNDAFKRRGTEVRDKESTVAVQRYVTKRVPSRYRGT